MRNVENFTGLFQISKTLRFELKPMLKSGETTEDFWHRYINGNKNDRLHELYMSDNGRHEKYPLMKAMLDQWHKMFISRVLSQFKETDVTWQQIADAYTNKSDDYKTLQESMRKCIRKSFESHDWWKYMSSEFKNLISEQISYMVENNENDFITAVQESNPKLEATKKMMLDAIKSFANFSAFFDTYKDNRENMYSAEDKATSIANRVVNENFPKFLDNIKVYEKLKEICPDELKAVEKSLHAQLNGLTLDDVFKPEYYNSCISQKGIEVYNWLIGGSPNEDVIGINSIGNEYIQSHPDTTLKLRNLKMTQLFKQILSDRVRLAFLPEQFESDDELMQSVSSFLDAVESSNLMTRIKDTMGTLLDGTVNLEKVYVQGTNLTKLSSMLYGGTNWNALGEKLRTMTVNNKTKKGRAEIDERIDAWLAKKCFSVIQIQKASYEISKEIQSSLTLMDILARLISHRYDSENKKWCDKSYIDICNDARIIQFNELMNNYKSGNVSIKDDNSKEIIKTVLDNYMELLGVIGLLRLNKKAECLDKDDFYVSYNALFDSEDELTITQIVPLYSKVRSYLTRKLSSNGKIQLKFDSPTRANGWNDCSIIVKDNKYYLAMYIDKFTNEEMNMLYAGNTAKIVESKQQKTDFKNLSRLFFYSKGTKLAPAVTKYNLPIETVSDMYNEKRNISGAAKLKEFNKKYPEFTEKMIDYLKVGLSKHEDFSMFSENFKSLWKKSSEYSSIKEFCDHTQSVCYAVTLRPISFEHLFALQDKNRVLLFNITNKDFNSGSFGTPNLHTLYWNELFSAENMKNPVYKLSSQGVKFFFREAITGEKPYKHRKGSILVNKKFADGTPIEGSLYKRLLLFYNGGDIQLTDKEKQILPNVKIKKAKYEIIKNKRYYENKFFFHVPIVINYNVASETPTLYQFNKRVLDNFRANKRDLNIIGIDRGENNLIYVSVIDQHGKNIITPRSYNLIGNYNYMEKMKQVEKSRDDARKNWTTIEQIKDLKNGYLSQVVHEITSLIFRYNAIVIMENLDIEFKRGRFKIERQVYQNFEKMLMDKLNFLVFKQNEKGTCGTVRDGLQLTAPANFNELGKQNGWLFYVPAAYTSMMDPSTGFVNLFNMKKPAESLQKFFGSFKEIAYRNGLFYFTFDYRDFHTIRNDYTNVWTLSSHGTRNYGKKKELEVLTGLFCDFFDKVGIEYNDVSVEKVAALDEIKLNELWNIFKCMLKMRNYNGDNIGFDISPVASEKPFITGTDNSMGIIDADANDAYNIAIKGLYWLHNDFPVNDKGYLEYIKDEDWFKFVQTKPYSK